MVFDLRLRYQHPDQGDDPMDDPVARADMSLARKVGDMLNLHYPGHAWFVEAAHAQGVVMINIPALMGQKRYVVKIHTLKSDPGMRSIVEAGGHILERYNIPRSGFNLDAFMTALRQQPIGRGHVPD